MKATRLWAIGLWFAAASASAHEFWMLPDRFQAAPGETVSLSVWVGENFAGELGGLQRPYFAQMRQRSTGHAADLMPLLPPSTPAASVGVRLQRGGTHVVFADTQPSHIELPAGRFHAYLHDEGLDAIIEARKAAGTAESPGRERYRRHIKTIVRAGSAGGDAAVRRTEQRLEILPLSDPAAARAGRDLGFQVWFEARPLPGALVKFWHRRGGQTVIVRTVTDPQGRVSVTPPWPGVWMASVVHMVAATDGAADWDSFWGNLTFELPRR